MKYSHRSTANAATATATATATVTATATATAASAQVQQWLDWSTPRIAARWAVFVGLVFLYGLRVWYINGW